MGLDTSYGCWTGAYSAFSRWRDALARAAGYAFCKDAQGYDIPCIDWGHIPDKAAMGDWDKTPEDPLIVLIAHSDCEGKIHPQQGILLADRLETLLSLLPEGSGGGHIGDWRKKTQDFIDGLREAASDNNDVEFL